MPDEIIYEDAITSEELDETLTNLLSASTDGKFLNYNMRLFGIPFQYTKYCDHRTFEAKDDVGTQHKNIGRKFIENIMLEAPLLTIVPGKPKYLPAAKNKYSTSLKLLSQTQDQISSLVTMNNIAQEEHLVDKLRYYDFQQDYINYMKYVNIMCQSAAAFLDIQEETVDDGDPLVIYDWKNYRFNSSHYRYATGEVLKASKNALVGFIDSLKTFGKRVLNVFVEGGGIGSTSETVAAFNDYSDDESMLESLESVLTQVNYVQFYIDSSSGMSENASNTTAQSKIAAAFESGQELFKEVAFLANSSGIEATEFQEYLGNASDALNDTLLGNTQGTMGGILSRMLSSTTNVIKGDNVIFPDIYQSSKYSKSYSISIDLRSPYGNKLAYYINVLVPLFHLICLAVPKQTTANTYGSPFLIKAYYPGVFSCNMGIVESITIDKNSTSDCWTIDGFPAEVKVTLNIIDLYSDLTITPSGLDSFMLFISNSSLIEYIATNCGINLATPQLVNRVKNMVAVLKAGLNQVKEDVAIDIFGSLENLISSIVYT